MKNQKKQIHSGCEACPYAQQAYTYVADYVPQDPKIIIVADKPTQGDAWHKHPHTGNPGKILRKALLNEDVDHKQDVAYVYLASCWSRGKGQGEQAREQCDWEHRLTNLPDVPIVALGKYAKNALSIQGWECWEFRGSRWMIAITDPTDAYMNPALAIHFTMGLAKALNVPFLSDSIDSFRYEVDPYPLPDINGDLGIVCVDVETTSLDWTDDAERIFLFGVRTKLGSWIFTDETLWMPETQAWIRALFAHHGEKIGGHNFKFDMKWLVTRYGVKPIIGWDTMLMANVFHEYWHKDLKSLATYFCNAVDYEWQLVKRYKAKKYRDYSEYPREEMIRYLAADLYYNFNLYDALKGYLQAENQWVFPYQMHEIPQINLLLDVELRGFVIDRPAAWKEQGLFEQDQLLLKLALQKMSGGEVENPNSTQQVGRYLYETMGLDVKMRTKTGAPSTSEEALREHKDHQFIQALLAYRRVTKLKSSYIDNLIDKLRMDKQGNLRAHTTYNPVNVVTHRLSATAPAAQTIPHTDMAKDTVPEFIQLMYPGHKFEGDYGTRIKNLYTVPPGYTLLGVDGMSWEVWTATVQSGDEYLTNIFNSGQSPHTGLCDMLYGPGWTKAQKVKEKNAFFGWIYMGSASAVAHETGLPLEDIKEVMALLEENLDGLKEWREQMVKAALTKGEIVVPKFNYHMHYELVTPMNKKDIIKQAVNYVNQGVGSMLMSWAAIAANKRLRYLSGGVVALVHDAFYAEVPDKFVPEGKKIMGQSVLEAARWFDSTVKAGAELMVGQQWGNLEEEMYYDQD